MRTSTAAPFLEDDVYSTTEIACAAGVSVQEVRRLVRRSAASYREYVRRADAIRLVRQLKASDLKAEVPARPPLTMLAQARRRQGLPLLISGALHAAFVTLLVFVTSGIFEASETEQPIKEPQPVRLVFFMRPGPGGGGGGGGLKMPTLPAARAERRTRVWVRKENSPVPPPRKAPPPPRPVEPPKTVEPPKIDPPKPAPPAQTVQAPVAPRPADPVTRPGVLKEPPAAVASAGPGSGGGAGTGIGAGIGEGRDGGIGPGSGGGTGGGPFQPGSGIEPPSLLREVKPVYTDEARKRSLEGDVVLEIVVRRDGSVGGMRVLRKLGAGLDERALEAVRQWRFAPARRLGAPVDVIVEVSVEFTLR